MAELKLEHIYKIYDQKTVAVKDFNLHIHDKEFIVFVGPSGCGKSTILRMIAGLEDISNGDFFIDGKRVNETPPKDRDIAMVFQHYALYPHMTVYDNMAFNLKLRKYPKKEIDERVQRTARTLGLEELLHRKPKALSGGQRQRVALGRALIREPKVFLMDEPLSNLDAKLRVQMRAEITKLHRQMQTTTIYVTHDQTEAMTMASRIVVLKDGEIQQVGPPTAVYEKPENVFVADFIGSPAMNFFHGEIDGKHLMIGNHSFLIPDAKWAALRKQSYNNKPIIFGIRPEHIYQEESGIQSPYTALSTKIEMVEITGAESLLYGILNGQNFVARLNTHTEITTETKINLIFDMDKGHFFDKESLRRIT
ncbi:ABC transporter ATP-binding protein [Bacillus dakarensis]|uniref:ABC transporter ATP-binding protein n=1 Tax=Robertmurraya dakarensis TaxID=1926278 RepID=UPI000981AFD0|nr:sn-glycerol-3-phosphate ABC transporter ATP-binding protein UgpC [Bacillus dakarensis]